MSEILSAETMTLWRRRHLDQALSPSTYTRVIDSHEALRERVALLERVARAARARHEVWSRETYVEMDDALAAFDNQETGGAR